MDKIIPTAKKLLKQEYIADSGYLGDDKANYKWEEGEADLATHTAIYAMTKFAKLHVEAALKAAAENAEVEYDYPAQYGGEPIIYIGRKSILNAYPLTNIK